MTQISPHKRKSNAILQTIMVVLAIIATAAMPLPNTSVRADTCSVCQTVSCRTESSFPITPNIITSATATVRSSGTVDFTINLHPVHIMTGNQPCNDPDGLQISGGTNVCGPSSCTQILQGFRTVTMSVTYCNTTDAMTPCFVIKFQSYGALGLFNPSRKTFQILSFTPGANPVDVPVDVTGSVQSD